MKIKVMPMIGTVRNERLESLRGCHALTERSVFKEVNAITLGPTLEKAIKELLLADRVGSLGGSAQFIVQIDLD